MSDFAVMTASADAIEGILRDELANGDAAQGTITPILRHLLANDDSSVFSDEIIARVRGMAADLARQLLDELVRADGEDERREHTVGEIAALSAAFIDNATFLRHLHALALEFQLTERLQSRLALDPVLPPLLQTLIASDDQTTASRAMKLLAAQARFVQSARRMQLPLHELPGDLLHAALVAMRTLAGVEPQADRRAELAEVAVRTSHDESRNRLGLLARLVASMGAGAASALSVTDAGPALFVTALSFATGQERDLCVAATNEAQVARLALSLRAAGLKPAAIEEQFLAFHPEIALPEGFDRLGSDRAAALLAAAVSLPGH
jgi:hypothetical protein